MNSSYTKRKYSTSQLIANTILYYTLFVGFFIYNFGFPESMLYFTDLLNVLLLLLSINRILKNIRKKPLRLYLLFIIFACLVGLLSATINGIDFLLFIWSCRNWGRAICFFLACSSIISERQADKAISLSKGLFHVNFFVILIQFFLFRSRYTQDSLNGLFGRNTSGVNVTFLMIILSIVLAEYFVHKIKIQELITYLVEYNIICILAELRALMLFEIVFIALYAAVNFKGSGKQLVRYVGLIVIVVIGATSAAGYLAKIYPEFAGFLTIEGVLKSANSELGYGFSGYIDRLNFITVINKYLFNGNTFKYLFGRGMGNAEYSAVSRLCSNFYNSYGTTFAYLRFSSSMIFLECGILGLLLFASAYVYLFMQSVRKIRSKKLITKLLAYEEMEIGFIATIIIFLFYNNLQRTDTSFILAFFSAIAISISRQYYIDRGKQ